VWVRFPPSACAVECINGFTSFSGPFALTDDSTGRNLAPFTDRTALYSLYELRQSGCQARR
jgi:hypothetical protein